MLKETGGMQPRASIITLGVADVAKARRFYEALGFKASAASQASITFFDAGGIVLALYGRAALAEDAHVAAVAPTAPEGFSGATQSFSGVTIAHNCRNEAEVDAVLAGAVTAGATLQKPAQKVFWGGYSGYFADPDGHLWEVAYNPHFAFDAAGRLRLP